MLPTTDMSIIGACFHGHAPEIDRSGFQPEWLESLEAREIVGAVFTLARQNKPVNVLNIMALTRGVPQEVWRTVLDISKNGYGDVDWRNSVRASKEAYLTREMSRINTEMAILLRTSDMRPSLWLPRLATKINTLLDTGQTKDADPKSLFEKSVPQIHWLSLIPEVNHLMGGGYRDGMLMIYVGCTGHGKSTALITHTVDCVLQGRRVSVIVNELMPEVFFKRVLRGASGLTEGEIERKQGNTPERHELLMQWVDYLQGVLRVYDSDMYSPRMMERVVAWDSAEALVVDYLKGQNVDGSRGVDPAGDMAFSMMDIYRSKRIPIITAGQMSDSNSKSFVKNDGAQPAIVYGSARTMQASSAYVGMKRDNLIQYVEYFRAWKNSFTGEMDFEERIPFDREKFIYRIPAEQLRRQAIGQRNTQA